MQDGHQPIHIAIGFGQLEFYYFLVKKYNIDLTIATPVKFILVANWIHEYFIK